MLVYTGNHGFYTRSSKSTQMRTHFLNKKPSKWSESGAQTPAPFVPGKETFPQTSPRVWWRGSRLRSGGWEFENRRNTQFSLLGCTLRCSTRILRLPSDDVDTVHITDPRPTSKKGPRRVRGTGSESALGNRLQLGVLLLSQTDSSINMSLKFVSASQGPTVFEISTAPLTAWRALLSPLSWAPPTRDEYQRA